MAVGFAAPAWGETIDIYAAGSLTKVVEALSKAAAPAAGVEIRPTFGPAGKLRARIEGGETPDLFFSAEGFVSPNAPAGNGRPLSRPDGPQIQVCRPIPLV